MKQHYLFLVLLVAFISCNNYNSLDSLEQDTSNIYHEINSCEAKEIIAGLGYDTTHFEDKYDYYLVERTYRFYKEDMYKFKKKHTQSTGYTKSSTSQQTLPKHYRHLYLELSNDAWLQLFDDAASAWNNINTDIQFSTKAREPDVTPDFPVRVSIIFEENYSSSMLQFTVHPDINSLFSSVHINTSCTLWTSLQDEGKLDHLAMHILGRIIGLKEIHTYDEDTFTIMYSPLLAASKPTNIWCDGITSEDITTLQTLYSQNNKKDYTTSWSPTLIGTDEHFVITGQPYTITIKNNTECCKNINVTRSFVVTDTHGEDITNNVLTYDTTDENKVTIIFPENGTYTFYFSVIDNNLDYISPIHTEAISVTARGRRFEWDAVSSMQLGTTYKISYIPDIPDQQTRAGEYQIAYYLREAMYSNGNIIASSTQTSNFAKLSVNGDECSVTLLFTGCYYLEAITTLNGVAINTDYCNITKLPRLPQEAELRLLNAYNESMVSGLENNEATLPKKDSLFYALRFPNANYTGSSNNRVGYLVEYEYEEMHSDMHPRRLDRQWHLDYHTIEHTSLKISKTLPPLYYRYGSTYDWRKEHYTGHIYCPTDGIRETETMSLLELPMQRVIAQGYENIILVSENDRKIIVEE